MNHADTARDFYLSVFGLPFRSVRVIGMENARMPMRLAVDADKVRTLRVLLTVARSNLKPGSAPIAFEIRDAAGKEVMDAGAVFVSGAAP